MGWSLAVQDFFEYFEELGFLDLVISWWIHSLDELVNLSLADLTARFHVGESVIDQVENLTWLQTLAFVSVVLGEHAINSLPQLLIGYWHDTKYLNKLIDLRKALCEIWEQNH